MSKTLQATIQFDEDLQKYKCFTTSAPYFLFAGNTIAEVKSLATDAISYYNKACKENIKLFFG